MKNLAKLLALSTVAYMWVLAPFIALADDTMYAWKTNCIPSESSAHLVTWSFTINDTPLSSGQKTASIIKRSSDNTSNKRFEIPEYVYATNGNDNVISYYVTDVGGPTSTNRDYSARQSGFVAVGSGGNLKEVLMPSVTNINFIVDSGTYERNTGLTNVVARNLVKVGNNSFNGCSTLQNVDMPNVRSVGSSAFNSCRVLTSLPFCNNLRSIGGAAFNWCASLTSLTLNKVRKLNNINNMTVGNGAGDNNVSGFFPNCTNIKVIQFPFLEGLTYPRTQMFYNCSNLTTLVLARFKGMNLSYCIQTGEGIFRKTYNLTEIKLPYCTTNFYANYVTNYYIHRASPLTNESYRSTKLINNYYYRNNGDLKKNLDEVNNMPQQYGITLYGNYQDDVEKGIRWVYEYLPSEEDRQSILLLDAIKSPETEVEGAPLWGDVTKVPESFEGLPVTTIQFGAFSDQTLKKVKFPSTVTEIRYGTFANCPNLTEIMIPSALVKSQGVELRESLDEGNEDHNEPIIISKLQTGGLMIIVK